MSARSLLVRGLLVGLLAGFASFLVAHQVGEPQVERAIALEEAGSVQHGHDDAATSNGATNGTNGTDGPADSTADSTADGTALSPDATATATHSHDEGTAVVPRANQSTWGLLTGTLAVGLALGGLVALICAAVVGRLGRLTPAQSTAVVALVGFVSFALVPFLKYPATPPAVGSADTIGERTGYYFTFVLISVVAAVVAVVAAQQWWRRIGAYGAAVTAAGGYLAVMVLVGELMPSVNEVGDFPGDALWFFRRASLMTLAALWAVIGVGLAGAVGRLHRQASAVTARRELAASL